MNQQEYKQSFDSDLLEYNISLDQYKNIVSSLPDKKFYEYAYHKFFNSDANFETWSSWDVWNYPVQDALRFDHILLDNKSHFQNKTVLDLGCHLGYMSLMISHLGAVHVTGTNVRSRELDISQEVAQHAGHSNVKFVNSDINNLDELATLCNNHQTILFSGLIYHVPNPLSVIEVITSSSAQSLIIDNIELDETKDVTGPVIFYRTDQVNSSIDGYKKNSNTMLVGVPNQSWIDFCLEYAGWTKISDISYRMIHQVSKNRRVSTWTKV